MGTLDKALPPPPTTGREIRNRTFSGSQVGQLQSLLKPGKMIVRDCTLKDSSDRVLDGSLPQDILLFHNTYQNLHPMKNGQQTLLFYVGTSKGTSRDRYGLKLVGENFIGVKSDDTIEIKSSGVDILNCTGSFSVRSRHGVDHRVINSPGLTKHKRRCGPHLTINCPRATVTDYAGNLFGKEGEWEDDHIGGGGHNMQCAYRCQSAGVAQVVLGYHFGDNDKKFPATECNVAPGVKYTKILEKGTTFKPVPVPAARSRDVDYDLLPKDARQAARELDLWWDECMAACGA